MTNSQRMRLGRLRSNPVCPDRPRNVLQRLLAHILEREVEPARGVFPHARRNADAARLGEAFEVGRDVDAITKDVAVLADDSSDVDPDAEVDAVIRRQRGVALG